MSRKKKGGSTASQKATSIAAVGLFVFKAKGAIVWVLDSASFQNRRRRGGGVIMITLDQNHEYKSSLEGNCMETVPNWLNFINVGNGHGH